MPGTPLSEPSPTGPAVVAAAPEEERVDAPVNCALETVGPQAAALHQPCGPFLSRSAFDLFSITVRVEGLWVFDTCASETGALDTVLALYRHHNLDPAQPCERILTWDDDGCAPFSRLATHLDAGQYILLVSEQSGDLSAHYRIAVAAPPGNMVCPQPLDPDDLRVGTPEAASTATPRETPTTDAGATATDTPTPTAAVAAAIPSQPSPTAPPPTPSALATP